MELWRYFKQFVFFKSGLNRNRFQISFYICTWKQWFKRKWKLSFFFRWAPGSSQFWQNYFPHPEALLWAEQWLCWPCKFRTKRTKEKTNNNNFWPDFLCFVSAGSDYHEGDPGSVQWSHHCGAGHFGCRDRCNPHY